MTEPRNELRDEFKKYSLDECFKSATLKDKVFGPMDINCDTTCIAKFCQMFFPSIPGHDENMYQAKAAKGENFFLELLRDSIKKKRLENMKFESFLRLLKEKQNEITDSKNAPPIYLGTLVRRIIYLQDDILKELKNPATELNIKLGPNTPTFELVDKNKIPREYDDSVVTLIFHPDQIPQGNAKIFEDFKSELRNQVLFVNVLDLSTACDVSLKRIFSPDQVEGVRPIISIYDEDVDRVCQQLHSPSSPKEKRIKQLYESMYSEYVKSNKTTNRFLFVTFTDGVRCDYDWMLKDFVKNKINIKVKPLLLVKDSELHEKGVEAFFEFNKPVFKPIMKR